MQDIQHKQSTFDVELLATLWEGSQEKMQLRKEIFEYLQEHNDVYSNKKNVFLTREQTIAEAHRKRILSEEIVKKFSSPKMLVNSLVNMRSAFGLHDSMFLSIVQAQGTKEQSEYWTQLNIDNKIVATYAQTELGHGSNVAGLETTATYDASRQEFVINSPTLTATKWWPGGLGISTTHAAVFARLILEKDYGIHCFIVQIRDSKTYEFLQGVTGGDIGPKMGYNTLDNGFLRFNNVRIPRTQMLMRFSSVREDGKYVKPPNENKLGYFAMLATRVYIIFGASSLIAQALSIAVPYSFSRRQFGSSKVTTSNSQNTEHSPQLETQVIEYQNQQYRLFSAVANAYAFRFTAHYFNEYFERIRQEQMSDQFSGLNEFHSLCSALKAVCTATSLEDIEQARRCCGGHGFSRLSFLSDLYWDAAPSVTYEGDNYILLLQTAKFLIKSYFEFKNDPSKGFDKNSTVSYLFLPPPHHHHHSHHTTTTTIKNNNNNNNEAKSTKNEFLDLFITRSQHLMQQCGKQVTLNQSQGMDMEQIWNANAVSLVQLAKSHAYYHILHSFMNHLAPLETDEHFKVVYPVLKHLCDLFAVHHLNKHSGEFLVSNAIQVSDLNRYRTLEMELLKPIRKNVMGLVEAWKIPTSFTNSVLSNSPKGDYAKEILTVLQMPEHTAHSVKLVQSFVSEIKPMLARL